MKTWKIALVILALLFTGCGQTSASSDTRSHNTPQASEAGTTTAGTGGTASELPSVTIAASSGEKVWVRVEIADNPMARYIGLRGRESMPESHGMLFVYTEEDPRSFTMSDTLIPLSIAFIGSEKRIIDIQDMKPGEAGPYDSAEPAQYALEVNQGFFEDRDVKVGDRVDLPE